MLQHYDEWKDRRRAFDPAFAKRYCQIRKRHTFATYSIALCHSYLKDLVPVFNKAAKSVIEEKMKTNADGRTVVDIKEVFYQVAFQIISQVFLDSVLIEK